MGNKRTVGETFTKLGILVEYKRDFFKNSVVEFLKEQTGTEEPFLNLKDLDIDRHIDKFLHSSEGIEALSDSVDESDLQLPLNPIDTRLELCELVKLWARNKRRRLCPPNDPCSSSNRLNPASNIVQTGNFFDASVESCPLPAPRISLAAIDLTAEDHDPYLQQFNHNSNHAQTHIHTTSAASNLSSTSTESSKGKQTADLGIDHNSLPLREPESGRLLADTEHFERHSNITASSQPHLTMFNDQHNLANPSTSRTKQKRPRDEGASHDEETSATKRVQCNSLDDPEDLTLHVAIREDSVVIVHANHYDEAGSFTHDQNLPAPALLATALHQTEQTSTNVDTVVAPAVAQPTYRVTLPQREAEITAEDLVTVISEIFDYLQKAEQTFARKNKSNGPSMEERKFSFEKSKLLRDIRGDVESLIQGIAQRRLKREGNDIEHEGFITNLFVLSS